MQVTVTSRNNKAQSVRHCTNKRATPILGIVAAAAALGVTRQHLYYVLRNKRHSPILLHRYNQLRRAA